jgi:hypothetical protein
VIAPFALAPVAVVHFADAAQAGYTSVVISTLSLVSVVAGPLGVLVLPHVAQEIGGLGRAARRSGLWTRLAEATLDVALGLAAVVILASPAVVSIWLPDLPPHVVTAQRVVAVGIPGYVFYVVFRSYLDAVDVRPLSSIATVTGLACLAAALPALLVAHVLPTAVAASTAVSISVTAMGAVTWWLVRPRLPERLAAGTVVAPAVAALVIASAGVALHGAGTGALVLAGGLAAVAYSALLLALRRSWLMELVVGLRARGGVAS